VVTEVIIIRAKEAPTAEEHRLPMIITAEAEAMPVVSYETCLDQETAVLTLHRRVVLPVQQKLLLHQAAVQAVLPAVALRL